MSDRYSQLVNTPIGKIVSKQIGLPSPVKLDRYERGQPVISGPVLLGAAPGGRLVGATATVLAAIDADVHTPLDEHVRTAAADASLEAKVFNPGAAPEDPTFKALVFDASGIENSEQLREVWAFFHPTIRRVRRSGRVNDGAHVLGLDVPGLQSELEATIGELGGSTLVLDITDDDAPARIATHVLEAHGGVDVVVHNAGVTRDKTLGRMDEDRWDLVLQINLTAQERINDKLLAREAIRENGRIVCVSSMSGIAGNAGQTNYAASTAGAIGMVESMAATVGKNR